MAIIIIIIDNIKSINYDDYNNENIDNSYRERNRCYYDKV